ncbi:hypothetical protein [Bradyrhizobium sp.]|uniref:hypothetical protein n=1 Tax=Bradyrhizobium sp. TaxID=376 RepID=UPI0025BC1DA9|nr:hypothetical protein [Bradyrhizobium sp.]
MSQLNILGGRIYDNPAFKDEMNSHYTPEKMSDSVEKLRASNLIDLETMEFGQYQPILSQSDQWPNEGGRLWRREVGRARLQLTAQPSNVPLSKDEPGVIPLTKCALLDACVRKCFNSVPPIPMQIDVKQQRDDAPNRDTHDILLEWDYGKTGDKPTLLRLTMVCPYLGP